MRSEVLDWDESPVPIRSEIFGPESHRDVGAQTTYLRRDGRASGWTIEGNGITRQFDIGTGWNCAIETTMADGHRIWLRQRLVADRVLRTWTTITTSRSRSTQAYTGNFDLTDQHLRGSSIHQGMIDMLRTRDGLAITVVNSDLGVQRMWRLAWSSESRVRIHDSAEADSDRPAMIVTAGDAGSLRKTVRWLLLELTGIVVADEFIAGRGAVR